MVTRSEAEFGVALAHRAIAARLSAAPPSDPAAAFRTEPMSPIFDEQRGVFVTLKHHPSGRLRGCIGYPLPIHRLRVAIPRVAVAAAMDDPRFPPVGERELRSLRLEISILTPPVRVEANDVRGRVAAIVVGRDGLIVERGGESGLLLPQVPVEEGWDVTAFLGATCEKAGLPDQAWWRPEVSVYRFEAEVFAESTPSGAVEPVPLTRSRADAPARRA
ncbi:MAG: TIGR00296 family protein [Thermoplasmata archaeon]|nr:TIGR00296 family protein [Thermoplasmata archaeon]